MGTRREKILQKINPKLLKMTPKLSGDAGSFIDLDSEDSLEDGAKNLMMRFFRNQDLCEKNKRIPRENVTELTISSVRHNENNEICELISERLTLPFVRNDEDDASDRPGKRLQKLKMELQEKMSAKWEEEYKKRVNENKVHNESKHKEKKYAEVDDDDDENDQNDGLSDNDSNNGGNEGKGVTQKDAEQNCDDKVSDDEVNSDDEFGDDEEESDGASIASDEQNEEDNCKDDNEPEEDEYQLSGDCSLVPAYQPGGGMLYGGSELTQSDEGLPQNLFSPSLRLSMVESSGSKLSTEVFKEATPKKPRDSLNEETNSSFMEKNKLFSQVENDSFDLSEAFEFCSGKFPDAEENDLQSVTGNPTEENFHESENDGKDKSQNSFEDLSMNSQLDDVGSDKETSKTRKNIIAFEDSEEEEEVETEKNVNLGDLEEFPSGPKLLSDIEDDDDGKIGRKKRRRMNLHFSDEEDATNDCDEEKESDSDDSNEVDVNKKEEEDDGERSVHYDSEENEIINPREFFEKEAELSGSEWSGDEDERGLDEFDVEEGDADKLDNDQVRSQLEKIHIRRVLDDDAREVRLIQEILFEDGDLHSDGKKRDRKFKWKNLGTFDVQGDEGETKEDGGHSSEDEGAEEEQMRKIRHEKELFLMTKKKNGDLSSDEEIVEDFHSIKVTSVKTSLRLSSNNGSGVASAKNVTDYTKILSNTSISQNVRGSFLTRNEEFLSRLAKATSGVTDNVLGTKSSKNFVFATKSPEKKNPERSTVNKRQLEGSGSCSSGREKRIKILPPEIDTGPSILDFLV